MFGTLLAALLTSQTSIAAVRPAVVASVAATDDRIAFPAALAPGEITNLVIRISSPEGVLWEGALRVSQNQGANYSQNLSQASPNACPPGLPFDTSDRRNITFNVYSQHSQLGQAYRVDASWGRPVRNEVCSDSGTRTVQVSHTVVLAPGETAVVPGDAGLKIEITRSR